MDVKDIKKLLDAMAESKVGELLLETGDYKLSIKRGGGITAAEMPAPAPQPAPQAPQPTPTETPAPPSTPAPAPSNLAEVTAPIVGTFYAAPSPDAADFVKVGDRVEPGKVLCIIEAMKLMNEIEAETSGVVAEILVRNEEPVEYGQVLFRIEPG